MIYILIYLIHIFVSKNCRGIAPLSAFGKLLDHIDITAMKPNHTQLWSLCSSFNDSYRAWKQAVCGKRHLSDTTHKFTLLPGQFICDHSLLKRFNTIHDDVIKWKHVPRNWPFVRGIPRSSVNSPHKGQWRGALIFSWICTRINGWVNNRESGNL